MFAPALAAQKPPVPVGNTHLGAVALGHFGGIGLDLAAAVEAPHDQPHMGRSGVAERHRWAAVGVHSMIVPRLITATRF
jgi:hypothetical protein